MPIDAPFTPPRKKPNVLWWIGAVFLLLIGLFVYQLFGPNPPIVVSKQTTYITASLRADGLPDYETYWLEKLRDGATPENNAAVILWPALPRDNISNADFMAVCDELGLGMMPLITEGLQAVDAQPTRAAVKNWLTDQGRTNDDLETLTDDAIGGVMGRAWTSDLLPPLADWVLANKRPLNLIVEGSGRPRCFMPSPTLLDANHDQLIAILLPGIQGMRDAARGLSTRAMWHLGEGRLEEAWQDISALHRLARLTGQGPFLVEQLVAIAIAGMASDGTVTLLADERLSPPLAQQIAAELAALAPPSNMANALDHSERLSCLDAVIHIKLYGVETLAGDTDFGRRPQVKAGDYNLDWNLILRDLNDWYDRLGAAAKMPTRAARLAAVAKFDADLDASGKKVASPLRALAGFVSRKSRSESISLIIANLMMPALGAAMLAEDRADSQLELTRLAAALAIYRIEHKAYPESLDMLDPATLPKLPVDVYNGKPFIYRRDGDGYLAYTAGENGQNEGGSNLRMHVLEGRSIDDFPQDQRPSMIDEIPHDADDISIRVPRPAFKLPSPPGNE